MELDGYRILLIAYAFPPANVIGAIRAGELADWLQSQGAIVHVVSAQDDRIPQDLGDLAGDVSCERTSRRIFAAKSRDSHSTPVQPSSQKKSHVQGTGFFGRFRRKFRSWARDMLAFPDSNMLWIPAALKTSKQHGQRLQPNFVFTTSPPFSAHVVGRFTASALGATWVADLRDGFAENPYSDAAPWRRRVNSLIEKWVLERANVITSVSETLVQQLHRSHGKTTVLVRNAIPSTSICFAPDVDLLKPTKFNIIHTGTIYPDRRDPRPLLEALQNLGPLARDIRVHFFGRMVDGLVEIVEELGVADLVTIHGHVSRDVSRAVQRGADVLLLLMGNEPSEVGIMTGKVFEYLSSEVPILVLGNPESEAAQLVLTLNRGKSATDPEQIADLLMEWLKNWQEARTLMTLGQLPLDLRRDHQWGELMDFLFEK